LLTLHMQCLLKGRTSDGYSAAERHLVGQKVGDSRVAVEHIALDFAALRKIGRVVVEFLKFLPSAFVLVLLVSVVAPRYGFHRHHHLKDKHVRFQS